MSGLLCVILSAGITVSGRMGLPNGMVFGTECIPDASRMVRLTANYTHLNSGVVKVNIVGEHGGAQIPVWSRVSIAGIPVSEYCEEVGLPWSPDIRNDIASRVKGMGAAQQRSRA